jgi:hypothetical protein
MISKLSREALKTKENPYNTVINDQLNVSRIAKNNT